MQPEQGNVPPPSHIGGYVGYCAVLGYVQGRITYIDRLVTVRVTISVLLMFKVNPFFGTGTSARYSRATYIHRVAASDGSAGAPTSGRDASA